MLYRVDFLKADAFSRATWALALSDAERNPALPRALGYAMALEPDEQDEHVMLLNDAAIAYLRQLDVWVPTGNPIGSDDPPEGAIPINQ